MAQGGGRPPEDCAEKVWHRTLDKDKETEPAPVQVPVTDSLADAEARGAVVVKRIQWAPFEPGKNTRG